MNHGKHRIPDIDTQNHRHSTGLTHLEVAEMDHPIHHLADAEAMAEVVEGVATVVLLDAQLLKKSTLFNLLLYSFFL